MPILNKFYNAILVCLALVAFILCILWQVERNHTLVLKGDIQTLNHQIAQDKADHAVTLANVKTQHAQQLADAKILLAKRENELQGKINEIQNSYTANLAMSDGLRKQIGHLNHQLSTFSRPTVEAYGATAANNLGECIDTTIALERLALSYYQEREYFRNIYTIPPPVIVATDDVTGAQVELGTVVKMDGELTDLEVVVP